MSPGEGTSIGEGRGRHRSLSSLGPSCLSSMDVHDLILTTADGVLAVDLEQKIVFWNEAAEALLGYTAEEVLGRFCYEVIRGRDEAGCPVCQRGCHDMMMMLRRELVRTRDVLVRTKDGREVWASISTVLVPSSRRDLWVLVHLFRDVSRQKEMERFVEQLLSIVAKLSLSRGPDPPVSLAHSPPPMDLTSRERDVLRLLASGASTRAIAKKLFISPATARNHVRHILTKLQVHSRLEAVTLALRNGLI